MDILIQTRLPKKYSDALAKKAQNEGISQAAFLRRLAMQSVDIKQEPMTDAWIVVKANTQRPTGTLPTMRLGLIEKLSSTEIVFRMYANNLRLNSTNIREYPWYDHKDQYRFILAGGSLWKITTVIEFDRGDGPALELTLSQEQS